MEPRLRAPPAEMEKRSQEMVETGTLDMRMQAELRIRALPVEANQFIRYETRDRLTGTTKTMNPSQDPQERSKDTVADAVVKDIRSRNVTAKQISKASG